MAMMMTAGTNTRAIRSASCCTGALVACARATIAMICARTLSPPTWLTRITALPLSAMVAPVTVPPALLCTDADSPVIIDSSISSVPATTTPSAGMRSPALTTTKSPTFRSSTPIVVWLFGSCQACSPWSSVSGLMVCALRGRSLISDCTALPVPSRALLSSRRPTSTRVMTTPTDSKYGSRDPAGSAGPATQTTRL